MITAQTLRSTFHRIEDLKTVRTETWKAWHTLNDQEKRTKEEGKEFARLFSLINSLNYEIRGLQIAFKEQSEEFIQQTVRG